ncbi:MAG: hypothetical protein ACK55I_39075, partial [bacterium]
MEDDGGLHERSDFTELRHHERSAILAGEQGIRGGVVEEAFLVAIDAEMLAEGELGLVEIDSGFGEIVLRALQRVLHVLV